MAKDKKKAQKERASAKRKRAAAQKIISTGKVKGKKATAKQIAAAKTRRGTRAGEMRAQGDILRDISGREKGERTVYTGPLTEKGREERGLPDMTKWQTANVGLLGALGGDRALLRQQFTPAMQAEYMRTGKIPQGFVPPKTTRTRTGTTTGTATGTGGGLLGGYGYGGYGGYPVLSLGTPSGLSYPAAAEAAEGYAGALGFNIGPEGGLVYRPWEAQAWKQTGIDPNLWNAPFAGGGLLGGYVPPTTATTPVPTATAVPTGTTTADAEPTFHETFMAPGGGHEQALQRLYAAAGGDAVWGSYPNWFNRTGNTPPSQGDIVGYGESIGVMPDYDDVKAGALRPPITPITPSYGMPAGLPTSSYMMPPGGLIPSYGMPVGQTVPSYAMASGLLAPQQPVSIPRSPF